MLPYKATQRNPEHNIFQIKDAMKVQSYFNLLSKVGLIFPCYVSNFTLPHQWKEIEIHEI